MSDIIPQTELDQAINSPYLNMLKAAVPYVEAPNQTKLASFAKALELINTQKMLSEPEMVEACHLHRPSKDAVDMLRAMKIMGRGRDVLLLDIMIHLFDINRLIHKYREYELEAPRVDKKEKHEQKESFDKKEHAVHKELHQQEEHVQHENNPQQQSNPLAGNPMLMEAMSALMNNNTNSNTTSADTNSGNMINSLKSMLTPEQQNTFNMLSQMMK